MRIYSKRGRYSKSFYNNLLEGSISSARAIIPMVLEYIEPESVVDLGCGTGGWLSVFKELGIRKVLGVDGDYVDPKMLQVTEEEFMPFDLRKPFHLDMHFDLVVSLEVAEHLPPSCAETFIDSLTSLGEVILFSAAIPFQKGENHINLKWPNYWANLFKQKGYTVIDCLRERVWDNPKVEWWYAQNTLLYVHTNSLAKYPKLKKELKKTNPSPLSLVHPNHYLTLMEGD